MKKYYILPLLSFMFVACSGNLEDKAANEAETFTKKCCPTPWVNNSRTDSLVFDRATHTFIYYCTFSGVLDDTVLVRNNAQAIKEDLQQSLRNDPKMKIYNENDYKNRYIIRSERNPSVVLIDTNKDYRI